MNGARFVGARLKPDAPTSVAVQILAGRLHAPVPFPRPAATLGCHRVHGPACSRVRRRHCAPRGPPPTAKQGDWRTRTPSRTCSASTASTSTRVCGARLPRCSPMTRDPRYRGTRRVSRQGPGAGIPAGHRAGRSAGRPALRQHAAAAGDARRRRRQDRQGSLAPVRRSYAISGQFHEWATGIYENEYVKEDGVWKIRRLHLYPTMVTPYEEGWGKESLSCLEVRAAADAGCPVRPAQQLRSVLRSALPLSRIRYAIRPALPGCASAPPRVRRWPSSSMTIERLTRGGRGPRVHRETADCLRLLPGHAAVGRSGRAVRRRRHDRDRAAGSLQGRRGRASQPEPLWSGRPRRWRAAQPHAVPDGHHIAPDGTTANLRSRAFSMMGNFGRPAHGWAGCTRTSS